MKLSSARIVVTGALSVLGRDILNILSEMGVKRAQVAAYDAGKHKDNTVSFGNEDTLPVLSTDQADFKDIDIALHAGQGHEAAALAKKAITAGALFIDGSGAFALDPDVLLIVPEVNGDKLAQKLKKNIIASPNSLSVFLSLALNPLHEHAIVTRAVISTYQSVSQWGREAQDELFSQTKAIFMAHDLKTKNFPMQIAFNCYPLVGEEREDGSTDVEGQTVAQVKKLLGTKIKLAVSTVTVPCFVGDGMTVNVECANEATPIQAALWMTGQKGLGVIDGNQFCTHSDIAGEDFAYVARLREDVSVENGLSFWLIGDNLRKGSALNMVQIAQKYLASK